MPEDHTLINWSDTFFLHLFFEQFLLFTDLCSSLIFYDVFWLQYCKVTDFKTVALQYEKNQANLSTSIY